MSNQRFPSGTDIYPKLPRNEWFALGDVIDEMYPELHGYDRSRVLAGAIRKLNHEMHWWKVKRVGEPGSYRYFITED